MMSTQSDRSIFEQHAQTIIALIIAALIGWAGVSLQDMQQSMASMSTQIQNLQHEVTNLRQINQDRYSMGQAVQDWGRNRQEMDQVRDRLRDLERKVP
jgi:predicted  nucleic acid-binding Zn-ribbon protein